MLDGATSVEVNSASVCYVVVVVALILVEAAVAMTKTLVPSRSVVVIVSSPSKPVEVDGAMNLTDTVPGAMRVLAWLHSIDPAAVASIPPAEVSWNGEHVIVASGAPIAGNVTIGVAI